MEPKFEDGTLIDTDNETCAVCDIIVLKDRYITKEYNRYEVQISEFLQENVRLCKKHYKEWVLHVGDIWRLFKETHAKNNQKD